MREISYLKAVSEALSQEMEIDPNVFIIGEDVSQGVKGTTIGFLKKFGPGRVIDTPISEQGFHSIAMGAAMMGLRPVIEYQISEFLTFAFEQLSDQAAKMHYLSGGKVNIPITILVPASGAPGSCGGQHSDHSYPFMLQSGMKVAMPSTPYDAKGLTITAIRDNDPVILFYPQNLLAKKGSVPEEIYTIPLGSGQIKKKGSDITIIATGHLVPIAVKVAEEFENKGLSIEVFDPRSLLPLDLKLLKKSVNKTGRVVIIDDSNRNCGFAAEVSAILAEECFERLKKPIIRVTRADTPVPFSPPMEKFVLPGQERLVYAINKLI